MFLYSIHSFCAKSGRATSTTHAAAAASRKVRIEFGPPPADCASRVILAEKRSAVDSPRSPSAAGSKESGARAAGAVADEEHRHRAAAAGGGRDVNVARPAVRQHRCAVLR